MRHGEEDVEMRAEMATRHMENRRLADAVLRYELLGAVVVADVLEVSGRVLACAKRGHRQR